MEGGNLRKSLGTWPVLVAGVALVVASSTLVSDFTGYFAMGSVFAVALVVAFGVNLLLALSAADLSVAYPRAGALYDYARSVFGGRTGRFVGVFLGLSMFGMFAFAASGETSAGAFGLRALLGSDAHINGFIIACSLLAVIPNLFGIRTTAWVSAGLLIFMLGIRWFFGLAGFFGWGGAGAWSAANMDAGISLSNWFEAGGIITAGFALAFWSFVGIEFACSLAEEVREPRKAMPRGLVLGLFGILATSLAMGLGVTGSGSLEMWRAAASGPLGCNGDCPQLAVGQVMFGRFGYALMALASVAATLGTLTVAYAAMPRILYSIARDGLFFGPLSNYFGQLHPRFGTPVRATLLSLVLYVVPALFSSQVIEWLYSAAYVWIVLYVVFHVMALISRRRRPEAATAFGRWFPAAACLGIVVTLAGLYYAFAGAHIQYGGRALVVLLGALVASGVSLAWPVVARRRSATAEPLSTPILVTGGIADGLNEPVNCVEQRRKI